MLAAKIYTCEFCTEKRKEINGCPDLGPETKPSPAYYPDGIWVGSAATDEKRHSFDRCPGAYLRRPNQGYDWVCTVDGVRNAFDLSWRAHWAFDRGIEHLDDRGNAPPKLDQAITLIESENRARTALTHQAKMEQREKKQAQQASPDAALVLKGRR